MKYFSLIALAIPLLFSSCLLEQTEPEEVDTGVITDVNTGIDESLSCGDVPSDKQDEVDELVERANTKALEDMEDMVKADNWDEFKASAPNSALALYNEALEIAPGHCGALFGKSLASMMVLSQDDELNDFIDKMEDTDVIDIRNEEELPSIEDNIELSSFGPSPLNVTPEDAPALLLKASASVSEADPVVIQELQDIIATTILPEVNASISNLSAILAEDDFEFNFTVNSGTDDEREFQIDHGEIGPMLAGMRVFKSFLIVILAHNLDFSDNGSYDWIETISKMDDDDFDNLSDKQRKALDHTTGLVSRNSSFTSIRPGYQKAYEAIPSELLQALRDLKTGLAYGIKEAQSNQNTQNNDIYVVGTGVDADVDPHDLEVAIEQMTHFEKYFTETVTITYAEGRKSLRVNLPAFFKRTKGIQSYLPYYNLNPYEEWNDAIEADTNWVTVYLDDFDWTDECEIEEKSDEFELICSEDGDEYTYNTFIFCKPTSDSDVWKCIHSEWDIDKVEKGPFYFTDAAGNKTFGPGDDSPRDISDLTGKVVFPDPTFGGIFPDLTNENIFDYVESLEDISPYNARECEDVRVKDEEYGGHYWEWRCTTNPLPNDPSDLDRLLYIFATFAD
jgi:hypothetical protein